MVGGWCRDKFLIAPSNDVDWVVVGATPQQMLDAGFEQVGADFPVFLHPDTKEEYALARSERKTGPGYQGFEVNADPTVTLEEDLSRRDFTINAIAHDPETGDWIDPFGGINDAYYKRLRHTSPAFVEDPLRVLRMVRLAVTKKLFIDPNTMALAKTMVERGDLNELSPERLVGEMKKAVNTIIQQDVSIYVNIDSYFTLLQDVGVFQHVELFAGLDHKQLVDSIVLMHNAPPGLTTRVKLEHNGVPRFDRTEVALWSVVAAVQLGAEPQWVTLTGGAEALKANRWLENAVLEPIAPTLGAMQLLATGQAWQAESCQWPLNLNALKALEDLHLANTSRLRPYWQFAELVSLATATIHATYDVIKNLPEGATGKEIGELVKKVRYETIQRLVSKQPDSV